ncbi:hypothetical protein PSQ20_21500 [Curvibacter sp. RS43]|uniref:hypothetical protein n=1 Tax=Curvibacter microcysteis TaxID=3026419 RepID=UPI002361AE48|nr:hypothetical protein [Curvibacter sp. RS43]MDD0812928.1 hypothetical protein [Curvibacter sp. RS43]
MSLQHELLPLINRLHQARERQDWGALVLINLQVAKLLLVTNDISPAEQPVYQRLCDAHAQASLASQQAERALQGDIQALKDILKPRSSADSASFKL